MKVSCPKESIHTFLGCSISDLTDEAVANQIWSMAKIARLKLELGEFTLLIVEELSTTAPALLVALDALLRKVYDSDLPFGGKSVRRRPPHRTVIMFLHSTITEKVMSFPSLSHLHHTCRSRRCWHLEISVRLAQYPRPP